VSRVVTLARVLFLTIPTLAIVFMFLFVIGSVRYGGPGDLLLRLRVEVAAHRPHPQFVPTPLPTPTEVEALAMPTPTPTAPPTAAPTPTPTPAATPTPAHRPAAEAVELTGLTHNWQKWNNCGPATLTMNLSFFGSTLSQTDLAAALKPNWDDKNVSPEEMAAFARSQGLHALVRVNGDADRLRLLLSNGVPVLIETWLEAEGGMGHYRLLTGYDDESREWIVFDSYVSAGVDAKQPYRGIRLPYDEVDRLWTVFNRAYILIYNDELAPAVLSILGEEADDKTMWQRALPRAQEEVRQRPDDPFAWFNLGTDLVALGQFEQATVAYDRARVIGLPWRMLWYQFGPFRAYYEAGRYDELIALADATIATAGNVEETYYWKGLGLAAQGDTAGARLAWQRAVELNPSYAEAAAALATIGE
jgi:hypothetical protein